MELSPNWSPVSGEIYTWVAMDRFGRLARMVNNQWGWLPAVLLEVEDLEDKLDELNEFINEESDKFKNIQTQFKVNGNFKLDLYCYFRFKRYPSKQAVLDQLKQSLMWEGKGLSDAAIASYKGIFTYHSVDGNQEGDDFPIGYEAEYRLPTKMGDYFRHTIPTIYSCITALPEELRKYIAVSDTIDFTEDRVLDNNRISEYFNRLYS